MKKYHGAVEIIVVVAILCLMIGRSTGQHIPHDRPGLLNGEGMGMAKYAELNGYPGPRHVLELAAELGLTEAQKQETGKIFADMKSAAVEKSKKIVALETQLHQLFAAKGAAAETVEKLSAEIGKLRGDLRAIHLLAHVKMIALLSEAQIQQYMQLRGYSTTE